MNQDIILVVVVSVVVALGIAISITAVILNNKYKKKVLANSVRIDKLLKLNEKICFNDDVETKFKFSNSCNSKAQLDRFDMQSFLIVSIENNLETFVTNYKKVEENITNYKNYLKKVGLINSAITVEQCAALKTNISKFHKYEDKLFNKRILHEPISGLSIHLSATYVSPKGRNFYRQKLDVNYDEFVGALNYTLQLIKKRATRQYQIKVERSKMSDSLRYNVMKRDGFRCCICGSSAEDGVKLHVDHIVPVSRGGKTEMSNLRTLCDRCNLGKSDKIEG